MGIHCHIGSQIVELSPFSEMMTKMMDLVEALKNELDLDLDFVDIGSGLGIPYTGTAPTPEDLAKTVLPIFHQRSKELEIRSKLILEPGRYIVGDAAILLCGVNTVKEAHYNFVGVDAGFNLLDSAGDVRIRITRCSLQINLTGSPKRPIRLLDQYVRVGTY